MAQLCSESFLSLSSNAFGIAPLPVQPYGHIANLPSQQFVLWSNNLHVNRNEQTL